MSKGRCGVRGGGCKATSPQPLQQLLLDRIFDVCSTQSLGLPVNTCFESTRVRKNDFVRFSGSTGHPRPDQCAPCKYGPQRGQDEPVALALLYLLVDPDELRPHLEHRIVGDAN